MTPEAAVADPWVEVPFRVLKEHGGLRLDAFLAARLRGYSRARVQRLIEDGLVSLPARDAKASARLSEGQTVRIRYPRAAEPALKHETLPLLHLDESIAVVDKPGGVLSHPTDKVLHNTVTSLLSRQLGRKVFLAHRLDRETSGALVLALDPGCARSLYHQFVGRSVRKEYLAVVRGAVAWTRKLLDAPIGPAGGEIRVRQAVGAGASAVTLFQRLSTDGRLSLVSARPRTGRLHQIRAHLAHLGHPVVGDKLYIGEGEAYMKAVRRQIAPDDLSALGAERQLLHAWRLEFDHPKDGRRLRIEAPVPADFPLRPEGT